jgi:hypothetical protein
MAHLPILPATQTVGTLDPHTLVLELSTFASADLVDAFAGTRDSKPAQILAHEMCHWFDIVGTVWGQWYLDVLFAAYDRVLPEPASSISAYPHALLMFDTDREVLFPSYYKFVSATAEPRRGPGSWRMEMTSGVRILANGKPNEDQPILFLKFDEMGQELARQPITVGSLLELRALHAEIAIFAKLHPKLSVEEGLVSEKIFERYLLSTLYNPELTTYSAEVHLLSFAVPSLDVGVALHIGSQLADISLNLTSPLFLRLSPPPDLLSGPARRVRAFKNRGDRGYVFALPLFLYSATCDARLSLQQPGRGTPCFGKASETR